MRFSWWDRRVERPFQRDGWCWEALPEGREGSGGHPEGPGGIRRNGRGWESPQKGWED